MYSSHMHHGAITTSDHIPLVRIAHRKVPLKPHIFRVSPQEVAAQSMEGAHPDLGSVLLAYEFHEAFAHLVSGLVREGDGADGPWWKIAVGDEICDAHGEHLCLPTSWACEDLERNMRWMPDSCSGGFTQRARADGRGMKRAHPGAEPDSGP